MAHTVDSASVKKATARKSRWDTTTSGSSPPTAATAATAISVVMTAEQLEAHVMHIRISEITENLELREVASVNSHHRSPSPTPQYDSAGRRINTCKRRYRQRLEDERRRLINEAQRIMPNYRLPRGYTYEQHRAGQRPISEKVYIPSRDFPEINFIGQLLGPRGHSLADLNKQSGANIVIRGRGSVKEGRGRRVQSSAHRLNRNHETEPLHCSITADTRDKVQRAKELVQAVIEAATSTPEHDNNRKRKQLRDLAVINGTFRDDEGTSGGSWRKRFDGSPSAGIVCAICGNGGHIARHCSDRAKSVPWRQTTRRANGQQDAGTTIADACDKFLASI